MRKLLLVCPQCESNGRRYILGEIAPTGHILVQRVHGKNGEYRNYTIIGGNDFYLICDRCGEMIYFKKIERRTYGISDFGINGIHWATFGGTLGEAGTRSIENTSGTN